MKNLILFLLLNLLFTTTGFTQLRMELDSTDLPKWNLSLPLAEAVNATAPSYMMGVEYFLKNNNSIILDGGITNNFGGRYFREEKTSGFKGRLEFRDNFISASGFDRAYQSLQLGYNQIYVDQRETFCRDSCAYFQTIDYEKRRINIFLHYNRGGIFKIGQRINIEFSIGGGLRFIDVESKDLPADAEWINQGFAFRFDRPGETFRVLAPSIYLGFRAGYAFFELQKRTKEYDYK